VKIDQLVVGDDRRPLGAVYPDAGVEPGVGGRGAVDDAEGAAAEPQHGHRRVLDLDPLMGQGGGVGEDLGGNAHHGDEQVDGVDRLVHDHPAAVHGPGAAPASGVVVRLPSPPGCGRDSGGQAPEVAGLDGRDDLLGRAVEAVLRDDGDLLPRRPLRSDDAVGRVQGDANGLLDHDVLSSLECGNGLFRMKSGGGADRYCVDVGIGKYGVEVGRVAPRLHAPRPAGGRWPPGC
jgi:hypothetical protein